MLPWYERADFQRMWELAHDHDAIPSEYEVWHVSAVSVMNEWLARGKVLQIIAIRPDELLAWMKARGLVNTAATRLRTLRKKRVGMSYFASAWPKARQRSELGSSLSSVSRYSWRSRRLKTIVAFWLPQGSV